MVSFWISSYILSFSPSLCHSLFSHLHSLLTLALCSESALDAICINSLHLLWMPFSMHLTCMLTVPEDSRHAHTPTNTRTHTHTFVPAKCNGRSVEPNRRASHSAELRFSQEFVGSACGSLCSAKESNRIES